MKTNNMPLEMVSFKIEKRCYKYRPKDGQM